MEYPGPILAIYLFSLEFVHFTLFIFLSSPGVELNKQFNFRVGLFYFIHAHLPSQTCKAHTVSKGNSIINPTAFFSNLFVQTHMHRTLTNYLISGYPG